MNPLSAIYAGATGARNCLYDRRLLKPRQLSAPVISVGSISAGGAGKTPFVIMLGELLKERGIAFDVLSRGYGRTSRGPRVVDPHGLSREFGDEPLLIARRLKCPVIVGESRYRAGRLAEQNFKSHLHLLDDGFQHRALHRDFNLALLTPEDVRDRLLPTGRLRESLSALRRADAVVLAGDIEPGVLPTGIRDVWRIRRNITLLDAPSNPVVFCGIARPQIFLEQVKTKGIVPAAFRTFRDHHAYSKDDVKELLTLRDRDQADGFLTTEKDAINLGQLLDEMGRICIARVQMQLTEPTDALDTMLAVISGRIRKA